jgi:hypothetical protein
MLNIFKQVSYKVARLYSAWRLTLLLVIFTIFFWLFNFSSAQFSNPSLMKISGGAGLLDAMLFYTAQEAFVILGHYGIQGRELYPHFLAADFVFILVYSFAFSFLFTRFVRAKFGANNTWLWLNLLPFAIGIFDSVENICILGMLHMYPQTNFVLGTFSGFVTLSKFILSIVSLLCLAYLGMSLLLCRFGLTSPKILGGETHDK